MKFVIFDLDDVLYDYDFDWRLAQFAKASGKSLNEIKALWSQSGWEDAAECGEYKFGDDYLKAFNSLIGAKFSRDDWVAIRRDALTPIVETLEFAQSLKSEGVEIAVLTNNAALLNEEFARVTPQAHQIFKENMHCSSQYGARKPDPKVFQRMLEKYGFAANESIFIDDRPENIIGAKQTGMRAIHFKKGMDLSKAMENNNDIEIGIDPLESDEIKHVINRHLTTMHSNSPPESCHAFDLSGLRSSDVSFWSMKLEGKTIGCGALKALNNESGEIKSMHVLSEFRGRGFSKLMLEHILADAKNRNYKSLYLETGSMDSFIAARELYKSYGFKECPPFGDYVLDPNSCFFELSLGS